MYIHVVNPGETIYSIADLYGVTPEKIIIDNEIKDPERLVEGQTLVIIQASEPNSEKRRSVSVNAYAYPYINFEVLNKTLPYLTTLTIFGYGFTEDGMLIPIEDDAVIESALRGGVAPIMLIAGKGEDDTFNSDLISKLLNDPLMQDRLIDDILATMEQKNYYGLDIDFEYIFPEDKAAYTDFVEKVSLRLNERGYSVNVDLAPKTYTEQPGLLYQAQDYADLGEATNSSLLMTYEWGYKYGPPMAVAPLDKVEQVVTYGVSQIEPSKIYMGIPNYGYDWTLPFVAGESEADTISNVEAVDIASDVGAVIEYDPIAQSPFFTYFDGEGNEHIVWFEDARSIEAKLQLIEEYGLKGPGYWNAMEYFPQNWLVLNSMYDIEKIVPQ